MIKVGFLYNYLSDINHFFFLHNEKRKYQYLSKIKISLTYIWLNNNNNNKNINNIYNLDRAIYYFIILVEKKNKIIITEYYKFMKIIHKL